MNLLAFALIIVPFLGHAQSLLEGFDRQGTQLFVKGRVCDSAHSLVSIFGGKSKRSAKLISQGEITPPSSGCSYFRLIVPQVNQDAFAGKSLFLRTRTSLNERWTDVTPEQTLTVPIWGDGSTEEWPLQNSWTPDPTNYFAKWNCKSTRGLKTISRLFINPLTTHSPTYWKDSLTTDVDSNGNLMVFFTAGDYGSPGEPTFKMNKSKFDGNQWNTTEYLIDSNPGGVSSHDGTEIDYVFNKYFYNGWGPYASTVSGKIPGVNSAQELWGTGPLGLTTIRNLVQNSVANLDTCLHMNPSLFDYDSSRSPRSFIATLWSGTLKTPCKLPPGAPVSSLPKSGPYVYHFINSQIGWQLDLERGLIENQKGLDYAMNADPAHNGFFVRGDVTGAIMEVDSLAKRKQKVLKCSVKSVHISEASRGKNGAYYFLGDEFPFTGPGLGLAPASEWIPATPQHDIFVAY